MLIKPHIVTKGNFSFDDRGNVSYANEFDFGKYGIKRFYNVENHRAGYVRANHGHAKEFKYMIAEKGTFLVIAFRMGEGINAEPIKFILNENTMNILCVPGGYYHGSKSLTENAKLKIYSNASLEDSLKDDFRLPWDYLGQDIWKENPR